MKNKIAILVLLVSGISFHLSATTKIISNHFELFNPDSVTIYLGDTIDFQIDSFHNAVEVNESTWDSGWAVSNGGFIIPFGGGIWIPNSGGIYFFVCELHAHDGMVGKVIVIDPNGIPIRVNSPVIDLTAYPNPFLNNCTLYYFLPTSSNVSIKITNVLGVKIDFLNLGTIEQGEHFFLLPSSLFQNNGIFFIEMIALESKISKVIAIEKINLHQ